MTSNPDAEVIDEIEKKIVSLTEQLTPVAKKLITNWPNKLQEYQKDFYEYKVRDKVIKQPMTTVSLSGTRIRKVILPKFKDWGDLLTWQGTGKCTRTFSFYGRCISFKKRWRRPNQNVCRRRRPRKNKQTFSLCKPRPAGKAIEPQLLIVLHYMAKTLHHDQIFMAK